MGESCKFDATRPFRERRGVASAKQLKARKKTGRLRHAVLHHEFLLLLVGDNGYGKLSARNVNQF
jgi:hypothetical protein